MITTGKAADMCGVTPDAVLKWIKGGKITGVRTAGGHYRINPASLKPFMAEKSLFPATGSALSNGKDKLSCWEFNTLEGKSILGAGNV